MSPKKPKSVRICSLVTAEDKFVTWITEVGVRGKPRGTPMPPLFIMMAATALCGLGRHAPGQAEVTTGKEPRFLLDGAGARTLPSTRLPSTVQAPVLRVPIALSAALPPVPGEGDD